MSEETHTTKHTTITSLKVRGFVNCIIGRIDEGRHYPESEFEDVEIKFTDFADQEDAIRVWKALIDVCDKKILNK